jgi:hypothetical protein
VQVHANQRYQDLHLQMICLLACAQICKTEIGYYADGEDAYDMKLQFVQHGSAVTTTAKSKPAAAAVAAAPAAAAEPAAESSSSAGSPRKRAATEDGAAVVAEALDQLDLNEPDDMPALANVADIDLVLPPPPSSSA